MKNISLFTALFSLSLVAQAASKPAAQTQTTPAQRAVSAAPSVNSAPSVSADTVGSAALSSEATVGAPARLVPGLNLGIEIRPSYYLNKGEAHTENTLSAGVDIGRGLEIGYVQYINTRLSNVSNDPFGHPQGLDVYGWGGFLSLNGVKIFDDSANSGWSLAYQPRLYTPTDETDPDIIMALRNYFNLTKKVSSTVSVTFSEIPVVYAYSRAAGNIDFEHRFYITTSWDITPKLNLAFPILMNNRHIRPGLKQDGTAVARGWRHRFYIWPELTYQVNPNFFVGAAYITGDLLKPDYTDTSIADGFDKGQFQTFVRASF